MIDRQARPANRSPLADATSAFDQYTAKAQEATRAAGTYMAGLWHTTQNDCDVLSAITKLPVDVAGLKPSVKQTADWKVALKKYGDGADIQQKNNTFVEEKAIELHDALNQIIRYGGAASLAMSGATVLAEETCWLAMKAGLQKMYFVAQGAAVGYAANAAASAALFLVEQFGFSVDPEYLRIGADALQLVSLWKAAAAERTAAGANCFAAGTLIAQGNGTEEQIQQERPGQRVLTQVDNPFAKGAPRNAADPNSTSVDPATWRLVSLDMPSATGDYLMQLLEPTSWIKSNSAKAGGWVALDLPELQINGEAQVTSIAACPAIQAGPGRVVLGTFQHVSHDLVDVKLVGDDTPLRVTSGHKLWSLDRGDWVPAGELRRGERLATEHGDASVQSIIGEVGTTTVYNLDVESDHRYLVGADFVLAHNACSGDKPAYEANPAHDSKSRSYNPNKTPEPPDAANVFNSQNTAQDKDGTWWGMNSDGEYYRFFPTGNGVAHFSGSTGSGGMPLERIPIAIRRLFGRVR